MFSITFVSCCCVCSIGLGRLCYVCVPFVACFLLSSLLDLNSSAVLLIREATGYSPYTLVYSLCSVVFLVRSSAFFGLCRGWGGVTIGHCPARAPTVRDKAFGGLVLLG